VGLRVKILTATALRCCSVYTDHPNFGFWTRFKLTYSFPFFAFNYLTQCAVLGSTDGLRKRYSWFALACNTLGKTARSLKLLENDFFPRKVLEFVEIVLEFYWRVLEYWSYSPINHFERERLNKMYYDLTRTKHASKKKKKGKAFVYEGNSVTSIRSI